MGEILRLELENSQKRRALHAFRNPERSNDSQTGGNNQHSRGQDIHTGRAGRDYGRVRRESHLAVLPTLIRSGAGLAPET